MDNEMEIKPLDQQLYEASLKALLEHKVPQELAEKVSHIIASDQPGLPEFGRTPQDQAIVKSVLPYLQG